MKTKLVLISILAAASVAVADEVVATTSSGTITEYSPGTSFVVKEHDGPVHYRYGKKVEYYSDGKLLTDDEVRTRVKVGGNVHVHYSNEGHDRVISRVDLDR